MHHFQYQKKKKKKKGLSEDTSTLEKKRFRHEKIRNLL